MFTSVIFLAIFSDINAVDAVNQCETPGFKRALFSSIVLARFMEGKKWIVSIKHLHSNRSFLHTNERSLNVGSFTQHIF